MAFSWGLLIGLLVTAGVAWFWQDSLAARERANRAATEACARLSLQFLDGTVAFAGLAFRRDHGGPWRLHRRYVFDYTADSIDRRQGFVLMAAQRIESVGFAPADRQSGMRAARDPPGTPPPADPVHDPATASLPIEGTLIPPDAANVYDLSAWRQRRHQSRGDRSAVRGP